MNHILAIFNISFKKSIRDRTVYIVFAISFLFILIGRGCTPQQISINDSSALPIDPQAIAMQIAFHVIVILTLGLSSLLSMNAFTRELDHGTMVISLVRPISRAVFAAGKFLSVFVISVINLFLLGIIFFLLFYFKVGVINFSIFPAFAFMILSVVLMVLMGLFFSFFIPRTAVPLLNLLIYLMSLFVEMPYFFESEEAPSATTAFLNTVLPDFGELQLNCAALISGSATYSDCLWSAGTIVLYSIACWFLLVFIFKKRDI